MSEYIVQECSCVHNAVVYGLDESIKRAKFPMATDIDSLSSELTEGIVSLAQSPKGEGHDQWLTGVVVQFDLSFSNKAWIEAERYGFLNFVSSQSTMHRITKFDLDNVYNSYVDIRMVAIMKEKIARFNKYCAEASKNGIHKTEENIKKNQMYLEILYSNPAGFIITAGMTTNYRQLKTIYSQRKNHRLPEWGEFCRWIETLPYSELITGEING